MRVQTSAVASKHKPSPMVYNPERRVTSDSLNDLDKGAMSVGSNGVDKVVSGDRSDLDNLYNGTTKLESKGSNRDVSNNKSNFEKGKYIKTTLRSRKKSKRHLNCGNHCSVEQQNNKNWLLWEGKMTKRREESETRVHPVVLVRIKYVHQSWSMRKHARNLAGVKPVLRKQREEI